MVLLMPNFINLALLKWFGLRKQCLAYMLKFDMFLTVYGGVGRRKVVCYS